MKLSEKQQIFTRNVGCLIEFAYNNGYRLTFGESFRTQDQILLNFFGFSVIKGGPLGLKLVKRKPSSKTLESLHGIRLAVDFNLFIDGKYITSRAPYKPLAEYWKSLHPNNRSGYDWGWDANHFEMQP